jgi:hypothetical protein
VLGIWRWRLKYDRLQDLTYNREGRGETGAMTARRVGRDDRVKLRKISRTALRLRIL